MAAGVLLLVAGCGGGSGGSGSGDADGGTGMDGSGGFDGSGGGGCSEADCDGEQVCHPHGSSCVTPGEACTDHDECGEGSYCDSSLNACLPSVTGSPCGSDDDCSEGACAAGFCGCGGLVHERELMGGPLDVYLILDRTGSMGRDCDYEYGESPPRDSKACYATYALSDYMIDVEPAVDTRLAFHFMSQPDDCNGDPYTTPLIDLTPLPVDAEHDLIQEIDDEEFRGGLGTHIEGALRGLARYTAANREAGREMIGVLMTDGDPNGCEEDIDDLRAIIEDHHDDTGIRTFLIGMEGATEENLEQLASAGGAEPHDDWCGEVDAPCHYWNVGDGSGDAIASALQDIVRMAAPLPCHFQVGDLEPPPGEELDYDRVNVTLTEGGDATTIGRVPDEAACPAGELAWYYDDPDAPSEIHLCPDTCSVVSEAGEGARVDVVVGCQDTVELI